MGVMLIRRVCRRVLPCRPAAADVRGPQRSEGTRHDEADRGADSIEPSKVVIIDDVVTTGDSIIKAIDAVQKAGHTVLLAISLLDRNAGATEALLPAASRIGRSRRWRILA